MEFLLKMLLNLTSLIFGLCLCKLILTGIPMAAIGGTIIAMTYVWLLMKFGV